MNKVGTSLRLTADVHEWYKKEAEKMGMSMNSFIAFALVQYKEEYSAKKEK
jgi:predicted HicB family RNase H-like nuclease